MFAYRCDLAPVVEYLIQVKQAGVESPSPTDHIVLAYAAEDGSAKVVQVIFENATDATSRSRDCA